MNEKLNPLKKTARQAGLLYLALAIIAPYALMYVPSKIYVSGDSTLIAENILAHEFMFRSAIAVHLITQVLMFLVVIFLYRLLKEVNGHRAKIMVGFVVLGAPISFLAEICNLIALMILKGDILQSFEPEQIHAIARVFLRTGGYGIEMVQIYWGLWLIPLAQLVNKSGFIPRIFGLLLLLNGIAYILLSLVFILFPNYQDMAWNVTMPFVFSGELSFILWLLIKGVREPRA